MPDMMQGEVSVHRYLRHRGLQIVLATRAARTGRLSLAVAGEHVRGNSGPGVGNNTEVMQNERQR